MKFELRGVKPEDVLALAEVENACFAQPWSEQSLRSELAKENAVLFAALGGKGRIIGWAGFAHICGEGSVTNVAVMPEARRRGVGEALVRALLDEAVRHALDWLMLEVRISNVAAISLYQKLGFNQVGIRPDFYDFPREHALLMRHMLEGTL